MIIKFRFPRLSLRAAETVRHRKTATDPFAPDHRTPQLLPESSIGTGPEPKRQPAPRCPSMACRGKNDAFCSASRPPDIGSGPVKVS